jgi:hypothetical protein
MKRKEMRMPFPGVTLRYIALPLSGVDSTGATLDFLLSAKQDAAAAMAQSIEPGIRLPHDFLDFFRGETFVPVRTSAQQQIFCMLVCIYILLGGMS